MEKYYKIADLIVKMDTFGRTEEQAAPYEIPTCETVDIVIEKLWPEYKFQYPGWSDDLGEYLITGSAFHKQILDHDGIRLHSSAVVVDGKAYLFSAASGTGKSTHTQLWLRQFGDRAFILNDDKPVLRQVDECWYAYGTPWSGKYDISVNSKAPVAGIAMIERSEINEIAPYNGIDMVQALLAQVNRHKDQKSLEQMLLLVDKLVSKVPIWKLKCNMNAEAAIVSYEAMSGEKWR